MQEQRLDIPLEQIQIKGLSIKQFITVLALSCGAFFTGAVAYTKIVTAQQEANKTQTEMLKRMELLDNKIETIQINQQRTEIWQARMEEKDSKSKNQ